MSGIYISGMEMPVFEHQSWDIRRGADGKWYVTDTNAETSDGAWHELVPVPPHGALMDRDDFFATCPELVDGYKTITDDLVFLPAEEGKT